MKRVRCTFWALVAVAVGAAGVASSALTGSPGPAAGASVAVGGVTLALAGGLAVRILVVLGRGQR